MRSDSLLESPPEPVPGETRKVEDKKSPELPDPGELLSNFLREYNISLSARVQTIQVADGSIIVKAVILADYNR